MKISLLSPHFLENVCTLLIRTHTYLVSTLSEKGRVIVASRSYLHYVKQFSHFFGGILLSKYPRLSTIKQFSIDAMDAYLFYHLVPNVL